MTQVRGRCALVIAFSRLIILMPSLLGCRNAQQAAIHGAQDAGHLAQPDACSALPAREPTAAASSSQAPVPGVFVRLQPGDGATNVKADAVVVSVEAVNRVDGKLLDLLATRSHVFTWPARAEVDADVTISTAGARAQIAWTPRHALADGWYTLEVGPLEPPLQWSSPAALIINDEGIASSRFRVGSEPMVTGISVCTKAGNRTALVVETSESVVVSEPLEEHIEVSTSQGKAQCAAWPPTDAGIIELVCALPGCASVTVSLAQAFSATASPHAPADASTAVFSFDPAALPDYGGGCRFFRAR